MKKELSFFKLKSKTLSILENSILVKDGRGIQTDLQTWISKPISLPDGVWDLKGLSVGIQKQHEAPEDYPVFPDLGELEGSIKIEAELLHKAVNYTDNKDPFRPFKQYICIKDGFLYATDAHVLLFEEVEKTEFVSNVLGTIVKFLPKKGVVEILKYKEYSQCKIDDIIITYRNFDGRFPEYTAVIPTENPNTLSFNPKLIDFDKLEFASNKTTNAVEFYTCPEGLILRSKDIDMDTEFQQLIPATFNNEGMEMRFNLKHLRMIFKDLDQVNIEFSSPNRAIVVNKNSLVMPIMRK